MAGVSGTVAGVPPGSSKGGKPVDMTLEVVVLPVADVDRAKRFYETLGFRLDIDYSSGEDFRVVQFTPPGSECSVTIGNGITTATPGSVQGLHLIVLDIEATRTNLIKRGIDVGEVFHDVGGVFHHVDPEHLAPGPQAERRSYGSFASFRDPDGNGWFLQEVTMRAPGR
jgi:catechol 2,3-dioxygenase-like lactoylglutathione lyase family enzyme